MPLPTVEVVQKSFKEFSQHEKLAEKLEVDVYFARPYSSWERGLSENTNGLFRQYFSKDRELLDVKPEELEHTVNKLNRRISVYFPTIKINFNRV